MRSFEFRWAIFVLAFATGILIVYMIEPNAHYIDKYPSPYDVDRITYSDLAGNCYKFKVNPAECTSDAIEQPFAA